MQDRVSGTMQYMHTFGMCVHFLYMQDIGNTYGRCILVLMVMTSCLTSSANNAKTVLMRETVTVLCPYGEGEVGDVFWQYRNDLNWTEVIKRHKGTVYTGPSYSSDKIELDLVNYSLVVRDVQISDEGEYKCDVDIKDGTPVTDLLSDLYVIARPAEPFPKILECGNQNAECIDPLGYPNGTYTNFTCALNGYYPPENVSIAWLKDGQILNTKHRDEILNSDGTYNKTITIQVEVSGDEEYTCKASGEAIWGADVNATLTVVVKEPGRNGEILTVIIVVITLVLIFGVVTVALILRCIRKKRCLDKPKQKGDSEVPMGNQGEESEQAASGEARAEATDPLISRNGDLEVLIGNQGENSEPAASGEAGAEATDPLISRNDLEVPMDNQGRESVTDERDEDGAEAADPLISGNGDSEVPMGNQGGNSEPAASAEARGEAAAPPHIRSEQVNTQHHLTEEGATVSLSTDTDAAAMETAKQSTKAESQGVSDEDLYKLARKLSNDDAKKLATKLGFERSEVVKYMETNTLNGTVGTRGSEQMLFAWKQKTGKKNQRLQLETALNDAELIRQKEEIFGC